MAGIDQPVSGAESSDSESSVWDFPLTVADSWALMGMYNDLNPPGPCSRSKEKASVCMKAKTREMKGGFGHQ